MDKNLDVGKSLKYYNKWNSGLIDFTKDKKNCIETLFCHHLHMSKQYNKIKYDKDEINYQFCFFVYLIDMIIPFAGTCMTNMKIRELTYQKYNIYNRNIESDIFTSVFCFFCSICQIHREMNYNGDTITALF